MKTTGRSGAFPARSRVSGWRDMCRAVLLVSSLGLCGLPFAAYAQSAQSGALLPAVSLDAPGADADLSAALAASSLVLAAHAEGRSSSVDLMAAARAEYGRLLGLLYEHGRFSPTISVLVDGREASQISPLRNPQRIERIEVRVTLGPLFTFAQTEISPQASGTILPEGFAPGAPARSTLVRAAVRAVLDGWRAQGHAQVQVDGQEVVANHQDRTLSVRVRIAPGPRLRFGDLVVQGNERTRLQRLQAIAGLPRGDIHDPARIAQAEERLRRTGTFTSVVLRPAPSANPDGTIDTVAELSEAPLRRLGFGAEIDSNAGGTLSGYWLHRNLLGGAERFRVEASIDGIGAQTGGIGFALDLNYLRPATTRSNTDLEVSLRAARLQEQDFDADEIEAGARLVRRYSETLTGTLGFELRAEESDFGGVTGRRFGTLGFVIGAERDTRDDPLDAADGTYASLSMMPYAGFGAADSGVLMEVDTRAYRALGADGRVVLAGRLHGGAILGSDLADTPRGFLFYSGGGGTVRGLPYQSLGVTSGGVDSGGLGFAALSSEVRVRATDSLSVVGFLDAGRVSEEALGGASDWHAGAGLGIRYDTPIGPLRLDLATPVRRNASAAGSRSYQIYLGIGQAF